jgi:ribosomal protein L28
METSALKLIDEQGHVHSVLAKVKRRDALSLVRQRLKLSDQTTPDINFLFLAYP